VGEGARLVRSVVWPASEVRAHEVLVDAIRANSRTVLIRGDLGPMGEAQPL
jgi:hypothetical protein